MARVAAVMGVGILALAPAAAREAPLRVASPARQPSPLLGVVRDASSGAPSLVSLDPRTLRPLRGRSLALFGAAAWAYSPSRTRLALAGSCQIGSGLSKGIRFIDVARLRANGCLWVGAVAAIAWPQPSRLLAVTSEVLTIDSVRGRVLARSPLPEGQLLAVASTGDRLVLLLASAGLGRLVVVEEQGTVASVVLDLPAGVQAREATFLRPGLALDPAGRAFVVPASGLVAEVSLDTLAVAYHELHDSVSALGRLARWLQPAAEAKELPGTARTATWLGNGMLAVAGNAGIGSRATASGLMLVDTHTWSKRMLDPRVDAVSLSQGRIVATGPHAGIAAYDPTGRSLYHRFAGRTASVSVIYRGRVYAAVGGEARLRVLGLANGSQLGRRAGPLPQLLLERRG